jgi:murein L,D-transpeptidase YafK
LFCPATDRPQKLHENKVIDEIWELVTAALDGGQKRFSLHVFSFRMTEPNFAILGTDRWDQFWRDLKKGYDLFEASHTPPQVTRIRVRPQTTARRD